MFNPEYSELHTPEFIEVATINLKHCKHLRKDAPIHKPTEESLLGTQVQYWTPILMDGKKLIDGVQRVLVARKHGYQEIPVQYVEKK